MQKNVTGQKMIVFAFDRTDNTPVTGDAANITANLRKDNGSAVATNDTNPTETEDGFYAFDLTQAETNADTLQGFPESTTADVQVIAVPGVIYTTPVNFGNDIIQSADNDTKISDIPTNSEFNARTIVSANYALEASVQVIDGNVDSILVDTGTTLPAQITGLNDFDPATEAVANVTLVATTTTNTDMVATAPTTAQIWAEATRELTSGTNIVLAKGVGLTGLNDISVANIFAGGDIDGFNLEESQKLILAASVGVLSGAATTSITIQAADGSKTRITAAVDANGNRSSVIKDATG